MNRAGSPGRQATSRGTSPSRRRRVHRAPGSGGEGSQRTSSPTRARRGWARAGARRRGGGGEGGGAARRQGRTRRPEPPQASHRAEPLQAAHRPEPAQPGHGSRASKPVPPQKRHSPTASNPVQGAHRPVRPQNPHGTSEGSLSRPGQAAGQRSEPRSKGRRHEGQTQSTARVSSTKAAPGGRPENRTAASRSPVPQPQRAVQARSHPPLRIQGKVYHALRACRAPSVGAWDSI